MRGRVEDALASLEVGRGRENGRELRETLRSFLDIDGERRMEAFKRYDVGGEVRRNVENYSEGRDCECLPRFSHCRVCDALRADLLPLSSEFYSQANHLQRHYSQVYPSYLPRPSAARESDVLACSRHPQGRLASEVSI